MSRAYQTDKFTRAYMEALLWSTTNDRAEELGQEEFIDANYSIDDFSDEALDKIIADCQKFQAEFGHLLTDENRTRQATGGYTTIELAGHDFWLTSQGHGCGFWDGDWEDSVGDILTKASKAYGECWPYVGDDGKIHIDG